MPRGRWLIRAERSAESERLAEAFAKLPEDAFVAIDRMAASRHGVGVGAPGRRAAVAPNHPDHDGVVER